MCICDKKCRGCIWRPADVPSSMEKCDLSTLKYIKTNLCSLWFSCPDPGHKAYSIIVHACEIPLMEKLDPSLGAASRQDMRNCRPSVNSLGFLSPVVEW